MPSASSSSSSSSSSPPRLLLPAYTPAIRPPHPSVDRYKIRAQNFNRSAAKSPFLLKMSIGLRRYRLFDSISLKISIGLRPYRLFDSKLQQACGHIAFLTQNFNRHAAISPF